MKKHIIIGISLFSCFLMVSISLIPTVQSIEVEKEVKSTLYDIVNIPSFLSGISNNPNFIKFITFVIKLWIILFIWCTLIMIGTVEIAPGPLTIQDIIGAIGCGFILANYFTIIIILSPLIFIRGILIMIINKIIDSINPSYQGNIT